MTTEEQQIQNVKEAYAKFRDEVDQEVHDELMAKFAHFHLSAHQGVEQADGHVAGGEFVQMMSVLDQVPDGSERLPEEIPETIVLPDGNLLGTGKYEMLDKGYLQAYEQFFKNFDKKAPFNASPQHINIDDAASFCVFGDWGTGKWRENAPSAKVAEQIQRQDADYNIHLGDVYYAATAEQEQSNLVDIWPVARKGDFTLNSNHEMYNGAHSYYKALGDRFPLQRGCSYFVLENANWLVIGLDTAYHAHALEIFMVGRLNHGQRNWLASLPKNKKVIVLSHHEGYELKGDKKGGAWDDVLGGLGRAPDAWYWGHLHNAVAYKPRGGYHGRCAGHAALPYGDARELKDCPEVAWYESGSAGDPEIPHRVLNGYIYLELEGGTLRETFVGEDGSERWCNTIA